MANDNQIQNEANEILYRQSRLERIQKYIDENLSADLGAAVVSQKFRVSISTLHHSFKKYLLQSYHRYVERVRMHKALEMIQSGKRIREIMSATGYKSRTTFYKAFKRTFEHAPGIFKNY